MEPVNGYVTVVLYLFEGYGLKLLHRVRPWRLRHLGSSIRCRDAKEAGLGIRVAGVVDDDRAR